uniref:Ovule protein n=1 Tax=Heterorhabditis bacteriophora TaxID=37862 RepID=A0A1I7XKL1_HETBA
MTREFSYDEIYYPGDLDANNNDEEAREASETEIMKEDRSLQSEECARVSIKHKEELDSVSEPSPEEREKKNNILVSFESGNKLVKKEDRNIVRKRKVTRRSPSYSEREKSFT